MAAPPLSDCLACKLKMPFLLVLIVFYGLVLVIPDLGILTGGSENIKTNI